jgi:hypothetical protein
MRSRRAAVWTGLAVAATLFVGTVSAEAPALERRRVLGNRLTLLVPTTFSLMSDDLRTRKYPSTNRPDFVLSNAGTTVNVAVGHRPERLPVTAVREAHKAIETTFRNLYPSATWYRSELVRLHGREWFLLDLRTPAADTEIRNIIVGTSLDDRLLLVSFNATRQLEDEWVPIGNRIIQSIVVE